MGNRVASPNLMSAKFSGHFKKIFSTNVAASQEIAAIDSGIQANFRADLHRHTGPPSLLCARNTLWFLLECRRSQQATVWRKSFLPCKRDQGTTPPVKPLALLPQGKVEATNRVLNMVKQMDEEGFGNCTNTGACEVECPKGISLENIARMNREYLLANLKG